MSEVDNLNDSEQLFLRKNRSGRTAKLGSAASRYQEQLLALVQSHMDVVRLHICTEHVNAYGMRKGSATLATTCTTCPPPIPSVARRGEWSMGAVLDVYWHFGQTGDEYLGRILALLDPMKENFATLPPHWKISNPMLNTTIKQAMDISFGPILRKHQSTSHDPTAILLRSLACFVWYLDDIFKEGEKHHGHYFNHIPLFQDLPLLNGLKELVTTSVTPGVMERATGIPPHIEQAVTMKKMMERLEDVVRLMKNQSDHFVAKVGQVIEDKEWESGHVTGQRLMETLSTFRSDIKSTVQEELSNIRAHLKINNANEESKEEQKSTKPGSNLFYYEGKFNKIPEKYDFPVRCTLREGLNLWLKGQIIDINNGSFVRPYRSLHQKNLPSQKHKNQYKIVWKALFSFIEEGVKLPSNTRELLSAEIDVIYDQCIEYLKG